MAQRLIDANELKMSVILPRCGAKAIIGDAVRKMIDSAPTVDAVPVIRCKDCKYNSNTEGNYVNCDIIPQMFGKTPDDNYCSYAEPEETS